MQYIKYLVNREVASRFFRNQLDKSVDGYREIAASIIPGPKATFRCCIYKERHIIEERIRLILEPTKNNNIINVLDSACDECPIDRFVVTEACRGCLGHKCYDVCPKNAITIVNHRAYINQALCIECGKCKEVCPFNAVSEVKRPCVRACPVGAVSMDENRKAMIHNEECITCGACVHQCPFGAIVDKSFVVEALELIKKSWNNTNYQVYGVVAPAIASQFPELSLGQVMTGIKELGFYDTVEAALGADMVALHEAKEFSETVAEKGWKTSSCCPSFVEYVQMYQPSLMNHVSRTVSPMIATARAIKSKNPNAKVVFIGPCTAKKVEMKQRDVKGAVDVVLTFEELRSMLDAKGLEMEGLAESPVGKASNFGRIFARTGGVTQGVLHAKELLHLEVPVKPVKCDGIAECMKALKVASFGKLNGNFIEGMVCKNGCTSGAASVTHEAKGIEKVNEYGKMAESQNSLEAISGFDMEKINLERDF